MSCTQRLAGQILRMCPAQTADKVATFGIQGKFGCRVILNGTKRSEEDPDYQWVTIIGIQKSWTFFASLRMTPLAIRGLSTI
ncbi:hypothetical protein KQI52_14515 [bacterium]|nr:hypothetical protein [bacterium]MCB2213324.1 hypothetical protein [bacterium]